LKTTPVKKSFILVPAKSKNFKIAHEQDFLMTYHDFFHVTDADSDLELTCPITIAFVLHYSENGKYFSEIRKK
jgi:hypothetical protein